MDQVVADATSLLQVILIDIALSADNAVAVGLVAASLPERQRGRAVTWGILLALVLRIAFGFATVQLLQVRGLLAIGGLLLLGIGGRMWFDLGRKENLEAKVTGQSAEAAPPEPMSFTRALIAIVIANIALSLDNVLAVAGVSRHAPWIMAFGLVLSVLLMGVAATLIARLVDKNRWIGYLGVIIILLAGAVMIWDDAHWASTQNYLPFAIPAPPSWLGGGA